MSQPLHSLAEQALGLPSRMRPGIHGRGGAYERPDSQAAPDVETAFARAEHRPPGRPDSPVAGPTTSDRRRAPEVAVANPSLRASDPTDDPAPDPGEARTTPGPDVLSRREMTHAREPSQEMPTPGRPAHRMKPEIAGIARPAAETAPRVVSEQARTGEMDRAPATRGQRRRVVEPARARDAVLGPEAPGHPRVGDFEEARAPDVHIHINRVELTAVTAPAPSRPGASRAKKPMALDEYLRRRSGKTS